MSIFIVDRNEKTPLIQGVFNGLLVMICVIGIFWYALAQINVSFDFAFVGDMRVRLWNGFRMTVSLSMVSLFLSLFIGAVSAAAHFSSVLFVRYFAKSYVIFIRGTPLIMQIYLFFYIVGTAFGIHSRFWCGVLILSIFEGAYISEMIRGSILSLDDSQIESAKAVGFTKKQTLQYIIIPQLFARTLPALTGQFASIIKDSSLLSMISVIELTHTIKEISAMNLRLFESYFVLGFLYLCLTIPITFLSKMLERRFQYEA